MSKEKKNKSKIMMMKRYIKPNTEIIEAHAISIMAGTIQTNEDDDERGGQGAKSFFDEEDEFEEDMNYMRNTNLWDNVTSRCITLLMTLSLSMAAFAQTTDTGDVSDEESAAMARTKQNAITLQETDPNGANYLNERRALVGRHCAVNRVINVVAVGTGTSGLENLTNEDITDDATFPQVISANVAVSPTVSVRDMKYYYAAGTTAGFCLVASSGSSVLSLDLVKTYHLWFYRDGKRVDDQQVREGSNAGGVKLTLIGIPGSNQACINLTAKSSQKFDEVALVQVGAVDASVGSVVQIKYAFVGDSHDINMTTSGISNYCTETSHPQMNVSCEAWMPSPLVGGIPLPVTSSYCARAVDDDLTNTVPLVSAVQLASVAFKGRVRVNVQNSDASVSELFHEGDQVGFKYNFVQVADVLQLGTWVEIKLYDHSGNEVQTTTISAEALSLAIASGGDQTSYVTADTDFSGAEISFYTALGVLNLGSGFGVYGAFVRPKPTIEHDCVINPTADTNLCTSQTTMQLKSSPEVNVTWSLEEQPDENNGACSVTADGFVTGMNADGTYKFRTTAEDGCYEIVTINHGNSADFIEPSAEHVLYNVEGETAEYALSDDRHGDTSANVLSISDMTDPGNILNADFDDYASYAGGLQLLGSNGVLMGVKRIDTDNPYIYDGSLADAKESVHVGFVIEMEQTVLGLNLLDAFMIKCFDDQGNKVYQHIVEDAGVLGLGLVGSNDKSNKLRLAITVPKVNGDGDPVKINEIQLWKVGALDLKTSDVKMYYAFWDDPTDPKNNVIRDGSYVVNYDNMGAMVNLGTQVNVASVGCVTNNLSNIIDIDDELETYALIQKTVESGSQEIIVKLGKTVDFRHQVGVVVNNDIVGLNANVGNVLKVGTYYNGTETGEASSNWGVLGANVIQGSGKTVLLIQPTADYDEIHITAGEGLAANRTIKVYGILLRNDVDHDGVPDNRDQESCSDAIQNITTNKVCVEENLTINALGTTDTQYKISLPEQGVDKVAVNSDIDGHITYSAPTTTSGRFVVYFYDGNDNLLTTQEYTVHPKQTTWRTTTNSKDWNRWENWTNGSPYLCTDVIMPSEARAYPSLDDNVVNGDEFGCDRIFFESRAAVEKLFKLNYTQAWVDVTLQPNRYYLLAAPLQDMFTGDMFVATSDNASEPFTAITGSTYLVNRFAPRVYQRLWEKTAQNKLANDTYGTASITETRWSKRFNALKYDYGYGEGFSLWVDPETNNAENFTFRFPKEHTAYNYFNEITREQTAMQETDLGRTNAYRFAFEQGLTPVSYTYKTTDDRKRFDATSEVSINATAATATTTFLIGNPFMSHIDVAKFLEVNADVVSEVKVYNGNTTTSAVAVAGEYVTTDADFTTILPMESFFVTAKTAGTSLTVKLTNDMFYRDVTDEDDNSDENAAKTELPMLNIQAKSDNITANALIVESDENVTAETLFDDEARPQLAVFTMKENKAADIRNIDSNEKFIPLGFYLGTEGKATVKFSTRGDFDINRYQLYDRETGRRYSLDETNEIEISGTCINRFYLIDSSVTAIEEHFFDNNNTENGIYVSTDGQMLTAHSAQADIESIEVFNYDGKKVAEATAISATRTLSVATNVNIGIIRVGRKGQKAATLKFIKK